MANAEDIVTKIPSEWRAETVRVHCAAPPSPWAVRPSASGGQKAAPMNFFAMSV